MQGALERTHDNQYHLYNVDGFANTITEGAKVTAWLTNDCWEHMKHVPEGQVHKRQHTCQASRPLHQVLHHPL